MLSPLLATKLYVPPARLNRVPRPRLHDQLNSLRPLTVIVAPAGFGKTTALSAWISTSPYCVSWLSLDEGDNDPTRFWMYVISALQKIRIDIGETALALLQSPQTMPITSIFTTLINEIAAFPEDFCIVLDDYHLIWTREIHEGMAFLLDHLPPVMHLILATRTDPPFPLARLRARNQLAELRASDLRFTSDEVADFLNEVMRLKLSQDAIVALETRTEGWAAGLQLAALSMQGRDDASDFIRAFSGSNRFILDYLTEEVIDRYRSAVQNFLLHTSILDHLNGSLCDTVTGQSGSQSILEELERANLFIIPLDQARKWYRYHHLFADVLRSRLQQAYPDQVANLHLQASMWFEQNDLWAGAVKHAMAASNLERAAQLIERIGMDTALRGEVHAVFGWLKALPDEVVYTRPKLCIIYAWLAFFRADIETAQRYLDRAELALNNMEHDDRLREGHNIRGEIAATRALQEVNRSESNPAKILVWAEQALRDLRSDNTPFLSTAMGTLGAAYRTQRDLLKAEQAFAQAAALDRPAKNVVTASALTMHQTNMQRARGSFRLSIATCRAALDWAAECGAGGSPFSGGVYSNLADLLREMNELENAQSFALEGITRSAQIGNRHQHLASILILARVMQAIGDLNGAFNLIFQAQTLAEKNQVNWVLDLLPALKAQFSLTQGDLTAALQYLQEFDTQPIAPGYVSGGYGFVYTYEIRLIAPIQVLIAQAISSRDVAVLRSTVTKLDEQCEDAKVHGLLWYQIKILVLQALAYSALREISKASAVFEAALTLAEPEGYMRIFLDEGKPMQLMLADCRSRIKHANIRAYLDRIVLAFSGIDLILSTYPMNSGSPSTLVEPLSGRELEVLRLIADGLSNRDIAERLTISTVTVKTHINNIFSKLYVRSRTQALARAHELGLLAH